MRGQFTALPGAVREYEIEEFSFLLRGLALEQGAGTLREFKQLDAFLDIATVRRLVRLHVAYHSRLLLPEFAGLLIEEAVVDPPVELVHVHRVDPILEAAVLMLELHDSLVVKLLLVLVAVAQGAPHPLQCLLAESDPLEQPGEPLLQHLLARKRLRALPLVAGAVVVHVLALFDFCDEGPAAKPARDQAGVRELLLDRVEFARVAAIQDRLDLLPQLARDDCVVSPVVCGPIEIEVAAVDPLPEDSVDRGSRHCIAALPICQPVRACLLRNLFQRVVPGGVLLEDPGNRRGQIGIGLYDPLAVGAVHVDVAERCERRPDPLPRLFLLSLLGFFPQVENVVACHQHLDAVHELLGRARLGRKDHALFHEVDLEFEFVNGHPILQVAVEAVGLFDQHDPAGRGLFQKRNHLAKSSAACPLGRLHINELLEHSEAVSAGVTA